METNNNQRTGGIVLACSGASDLGELTDKVARNLRDHKIYTMKCLAMVAADNKPLIETLKLSETLVIDGCPIDCGKKIMEEAWLSNYKYVRLTDLGYEKGKTPVNEKNINEIFEKIMCMNNENKITLSPSATSGCSSCK